MLWRNCWNLSIPWSKPAQRFIIKMSWENWASQVWRRPGCAICGSAWCKSLEPVSFRTNSISDGDTLKHGWPWESAKDVSFGRVKLSLRGVSMGPGSLAGESAQKKKETENRYAKDFSTITIFDELFCNMTWTQSCSLSRKHKVDFSQRAQTLTERWPNIDRFGQKN